MTDIVFILDMSGSMSRFREDTIGGYNSIIKENKEQDDEAYITTVFFDDQYEVIHSRKNIKEVELLTNEYNPRGMTALYDALGKTISDFDSKINKLEKKPEKVVFNIITDGLENASVEWSAYQIKQLVENKKKDGWIFTFIGTNMDVFEAAEAIGIDKKFTKAYANTDKGVHSVYKAMGKAMSNVRAAATWDAMECAQADALQDIEG